MTAGPLHPDNIPAGRDRILGKGHGTEALGPSDSSDSGSDTDRSGTGEVGTGERSVAREGADIGTDHIESIPDDEDDEPPRKRPGH